MDTALRESRAFEVSKTAESVRSLLRHSGVMSVAEALPIDHNNRDLYAELIESEIALDGYGDDWANQRSQVRTFTFTDNKSRVTREKDNPGSVKLRLAASTHYLFLLVEVVDDQVRYHTPVNPIVVSEFTIPAEPPAIQSIATGDHVVVFEQDQHSDIKETVFRAIAPGPIVGRRYGPTVNGERSIRSARRFRGYWASTDSGYQLEIRMPLPAAHSRLGFAVLDSDRRGPNNEYTAWIGTVDPQSPTDIGQLIYPSRKMQGVLKEVVPKGSRARVFDAHGRMRADVNRLYERPNNPTLMDPAKMNLFNALLYRFFEWIITSRASSTDSKFTFQDPFTLSDDALSHSTRHSQVGAISRYVSPERDQLMGTMVSISETSSDYLHLLFESNEDTANAFTSSAMVRMFSLVTLIGLLVASTLFTYATWLSWRIRKLSRQARFAVSGDGRFRGEIKSSAAKDEIGDMSRSIAQLVERSAGYTQYLESLASKLSHELRTPLSVVQTSLENLETGKFNAEDRQLLLRAQTAAAQLSGLIRSMSEAARLEQTVRRSEFVQFNAIDWLANACQAYQSVHKEQRITCQTQNVNLPELFAVPELLQQALDKLVANAIDFADAESTITLFAEDTDDFFELSVVNKGEPIQQKYLDQLFEPMYSHRDHSFSDAHLGLGLYVVKLIAEAHEGVAFVRNYPDRRTVQVGFSVLRVKQAN